jgi:thiamine-monophosphate kinase
MRLDDLGERRIIQIFLENITRAGDTVVGIGDDACAVKFGDEYLVVSTDLLSRRSHFPREMTPEQIGAYVINANLSDIASMGAMPIGLLVSMGLPGDLNEDFVRGIARGMDRECRRHDALILGGDTKELEELVIVGTALGRAKRSQILTRGGARRGDLICVTGELGKAAAGFHCLTHGLGIERLIKSALEPRARVKEGRVISKYASACIDISDGLAYSLHEIARWSKVGFEVREGDIPVGEELPKVAEAVGTPVREMVFFKGGDYELLFTIPPGKYNDVDRELRNIGGSVTVIGEITGKGEKLVTRGGVLGNLEGRGYEAFRGLE